VVYLGMKKIFLADLDSWNKVIEEESTQWVSGIITHAKLDTNMVFSLDKGKAVEYLVQNKTSIDFNVKTRAIKIHKDGQIIGEWKNQEVRTKVEDGSPFVEISVDVFSVKEKTMPVYRTNK